MIGEIFEATGTMDERGYYDNFGIVPQLRNIYGVNLHRKMNQLN